MHRFLKCNLYKNKCSRSNTTDECKMAEKPKVVLNILACVMFLSFYYRFFVDVNLTVCT